MAKTKTSKTYQDVTAFINSLAEERKRTDSFKLVEIMTNVTVLEPYMFGPTIIGFENYHYKYPSGHEGEAPVAGFSPRKSAITLYLASKFSKKDGLPKQLGKHKSTVACVYIKTPNNIDVPVLEKMITASAKCIKELYPD